MSRCYRSFHPETLIAQSLAICRIIVAVLALSALFSVSGIADPQHIPWLEEKDWKSWTANECRTVLRSSPWVSRNMAGELGDPRGYADEIPGSAEYWHVIQLRSALPIREARLRELQLDKKYDKMNLQQKQDFDQKYAGDLLQNEEDPIVVYYENGALNTPPREGSGGVDYLPEAVDQRQVALRLPSGKLLLPIKTIALKKDVNINQYEYYFPRIVDGKPVFTTSDTSIGIVLGAILPYDQKHKEWGPMRPEDFHPAGLAANFPVESLMYKGKLEY